MKHGQKCRFDAGRAPSPPCPAQCPGPDISLTSRNHGASLWGPARRGRRASPEFSVVGSTSRSQQRPSDGDAPHYHSGFLHACQQHLQSGLPEGWPTSVRPQEWAFSLWESQRSDLGSRW